ncbi:uncharacterized protein Z520_03635 [Fonsecaea multimorphosa CBS 102226]|uniref:GRIP domain-containing protein n=1 Tax=Fonsecaea multimorphosa CBS 102226 TaxID=1442371 RepID=A0A0D2KW47_9EURO|nr:uncharacterized protein Z520_03635 [Fonsecaea multimorphosa CBS 102226]KIY00969.1 hypothetical protein Z520_03635 [Fonsecaea multimorphosa CBS 102226]OAL27553.1 hypothetical protein AYO22_03457 [Fonsecaea multimorphosa]
MASMPQGDQKSKRKKKSKKKGNAQAAATTDTDAPTTPADESTETQNGPDEEDEAENDEQDTEQTTVTPAQEEPPDEQGQGTVTVANGVKELSIDDDESNDAAARFDALVKDRDALRLEVTELRKSLEELQAKHATDIEAMQTELAETQAEKENAEEQYQSLLGKVNTIRSQLGERLKADAEDLAQARTRIEELEEQRSELQERYTARSAEVEELTAQNAELSQKQAEQSKELSTLRNRLTLSQQNWLKEKEELVESEAYMRDEFENAKQAMHDWEVLAMEERTMRKDLADRNADLEEQLTSLKEAYEKAVSERDTHSAAVDGLQKALQEIQTVRKQELKELVETSQNEQEALRKQVSDLQAIYDSTVAELEQTKKELERALPFEKEVKEKNLLIGKLRHEAVILNDHLTKALRFLKKGKPEDNVDRQIVTNHFLHFLALDRSDPKKFQILQLIAALLGWTDEQREQAGLARPGGNTATTTGTTSSFNSLRGLGSLGVAAAPGSPLMHRTPSTPALLNHPDYFGGSGSGGPESATSPHSRETLAELWQHFLEQEAAAGSGAVKTSKSRQGSQSQSHPNTTTGTGPGPGPGAGSSAPPR